MGVRLFERSSKHVALTAAGQAYLAEVRVVLDRVASAAETARAVAAGLQGRLEIDIRRGIDPEDETRWVFLTPIGPRWSRTALAEAAQAVPGVRAPASRAGRTPKTPEETP